MKRRPKEDRFLNELVKDCITFALKEKESLEYITTRFGEPISPRSYEQRKAKILSESSIQIWYDWFTRIGFVENHLQQIQIIENINDDSKRELRQLMDEKPRNEDLIQRLKKDIRLNTKLLSELNLGTPVITSIKKKIDEMHARLSNKNIRQPGNEILP